MSDEYEEDEYEVEEELNLTEADKDEKYENLLLTGNTDAIDDFEHSMVWKDFVSILTFDLKVLKASIISPDRTTDIGEVRHIQGEIFSLQSSLDLPQRLREEISLRNIEDTGEV